MFAHFILCCVLCARSCASLPCAVLSPGAVAESGEGRGGAAQAASRRGQRSPALLLPTRPSFTFVPNCSLPVCQHCWRCKHILPPPPPPSSLGPNHESVVLRPDEGAEQQAPHAHGGRSAAVGRGEGEGARHTQQQGRPAAGAGGGKGARAAEDWSNLPTVPAGVARRAALQPQAAY